MKHSDFLGQLRGQLTDIKAALHDTVEPSVIEEIERAIETINLIEASNISDEKALKAEALKTLGDLLRLLPSIAELIKFFH